MVILRQKGKIGSSINILLLSAVYDAVRNLNILRLHKINTYGGDINIHSMVCITKITCDNDSCIHNPDSESGIYMAVVMVDECCVVVENLEEEIRGKIKGSMSKCGKKRLTESPSKEGTFIIYFPWYPTSRETPRPLRTPLTLYSKTHPTYPPTSSRTYSFTWGGVLVSYPTLRRRRLQCISCIYGVKYYVIGSRHHW